MLVPFAGKLVDASQRIIKVTKMDEEDRADLEVPDEKLFEVPEMAISEAGKAIAHMGEVALKNLKRSCKLLYVYDENRVSVINENEDNMDLFTDSMDTYLVNLSKFVETDSDSQRVSTMMQTSTNFERIGDHAMNIMEVAQNIRGGKLEFSDSAKEELEKSQRRRIRNNFYNGGSLLLYEQRYSQARRTSGRSHRRYGDYIKEPAYRKT